MTTDTATGTPPRRFISHVRAVDALQLTSQNLAEALEFVGDRMTAAGNHLSEAGVHVAFRTTGGGSAHAKPGDWIVRNDRGEFEHYSNNDFRTTFEPAEHANEALNELRDRIADAVREHVRLRLGPNALTMAMLEQPVSLSGNEADEVAGIAMSLVEDEAINRMAERLVAETNMRAMDFRNGMSMEIEPARALAANFVGCARAMLGDAENYSETPVEMTTHLAGQPERFTFVVQRVGKLTPHEARMLEKERADRAEDDLERLRVASEKTVAELERRIAQLQQLSQPEG